MERKWAVRHEVEGAVVYETLLDRSGMYVKSAQILASKGDFMPQPWVRRLAAMSDSMPPKPWNAVQCVCHLAWESPAGRLLELQGQPMLLEAFLETVEPARMASSSIAQVHGAVLSKGQVAELGWRWRHGREVVLKVQHPDMKGLMGSDVRNLGRLADFVRGTLPFDVFRVSSPSRVGGDARDETAKEFDFLREARLMRVTANRLCHARMPGVIVPEPLMALSSPQLLIMQRMEGRQLGQPDAESIASAASNPDPSVRNSLSPAILDTLADAATNADNVETTPYNAQAVLADQLVALRLGAMMPAQFAAATTPDALAAALAKTQLPGQVAAPGTTAAATLGSAPAESGSTASGGGLSWTLIIITSVCVSCGGVLLIAVLVWGVVALARRHEDKLPELDTSVAMSGASGGYWWRSPLQGRADSGSAPSRQAMAGSSSLRY
ncbi:g5333 [Coccomyxa elongata]